jgi:hypothetical protein
MGVFFFRLAQGMPGNTHPIAAKNVAELIALSACRCLQAQLGTIFGADSSMRQA